MKKIKKVMNPRCVYVKAILLGIMVYVISATVGTFLLIKGKINSNGDTGIRLVMCMLSAISCVMYAIGSNKQSKIKSGLMSSGVLLAILITICISSGVDRSEKLIIYPAGIGLGTAAGLFLCALSARLKGRKVMHHR